MSLFKLLYLPFDNQPSKEWENGKRNMPLIFIITITSSNDRKEFQFLFEAFQALKRGLKNFLYLCNLTAVVTVMAKLLILLIVSHKRIISSFDMWKVSRICLCRRSTLFSSLRDRIINKSSLSWAQRTRRRRQKSPCRLHLSSWEAVKNAQLSRRSSLVRDTQRKIEDFAFFPRKMKRNSR